MQNQSPIVRTETARDIVTRSALDRLAATLDHPTPPWTDDLVPPLGHWLFCLPCEPLSAIGEDGHAATGGFLPKLDLPRRMWAGSRLSFEAPLHVGDAIERRSTIVKLEEKTGRTGRMVFVTVEHRIYSDDRLCITEEQDLVYREPPQPGAMPPLPAPGPLAQAGDVVRAVTPDAVMLFRYSALTFNGHRIHYDADFTRTIEGYPGLIIHGPLAATMVIDHFLRDHPDHMINRFSFRALQPMYLGDTLTSYVRASADTHECWITKQDGTLTLQASITATSS